MPDERERRSLRVLFVEQNRSDVDLAVRELDRAGYQVEAQVVKTREGFAFQLGQSFFDVILADYNLPGWTSMEALKILQDSGKDIPFILVTGTLGEEAAVECIKRGVTDFVLKDHLSRLAVAVERALREKALREAHESARRQLVESEARYRLLVEGSEQIFFYVHDLDHRFQYFSPSVKNVLGYEPAELVGHRYNELLTGDPSDEVADSLTDSALQTGQRGAAYTVLVRHKDGRIVELELIESPVLSRSLGTAVVGMQGFARDITQQRHAEEALRESEESFRLLFANNPHPMWVYDAETLAFLEVNEAAIRHYGYARQEFLRMNITDIRAPEEKARLLEFVAQRRPPLSFAGHWRHLLKDGRTIEVEVTSHRLEFAGRKAVLVVAQDITDRRRAEELLRESHALLSAVIEGTPDEIFLKDLQGRYLMVNSTAARIWGRTVEETLGKTDFELFPREFAQKFRARDQRVISSGETLTYEDSSLHEDAACAFLVTKGPIRDDQGNIVGVFGVVRDITERKRAEQSLRESHALLSAIIEGTPDVVFMKDLLGRYLIFNSTAARTWGRTPEDTLGKTDFELFPRELAQKFRARDQRVISSGETLTYEDPAILEGAARAFLVTKGPIRDDHGNIVGVFGVARDITERRRSEQSLRESHALLSAVIEGTPDEIFLKDLQGRYLMVNSTVARAWGYSVEHMIGKTDEELFPPETACEFREGDRQAIAAGQPITFEATTTSGDGTRTFLMNKGPIRDDHGNIVGVFGIGREITERKRAEHLQAAVYRLAEAADKSPTLHDLYRAVHQNIQAVMPAQNFYIALYDEKEDLLSFPYWVDEVDAPLPSGKPGKGVTAYVLRTGKPLLCTLAVYEELERRGEIELIGAQSPIWLGVPLRIGEKTIGVMAVQHYSDASAYTERELQMLEYVSTQVAKAIEGKCAEQALRESEAHLRVVIESEPECVKRVAPDGALLDMNPAGLAMIEAETAEAIIGKSVFPLILPEYRDAFRDLLDRVCRGSTGRLEFEIAGLKGTHRWMDTHAVPLRQADGSVHMLAVTRDVTQRRLLERQLNEAHKFEAIGRLAGGIAHDFNNVLGAIMGWAELSRMEVPQGTPIHGHLQLIEQQSERAASLVRQLLAFARRQILEPRNINLNHTVGEVTSLLDKVIGKDIELKTRLAPDLRAAWADPTQTEQVLMNLCVNARDAMPRGGTLRIETHNARLDEGFCRHHPGARPGRYVLLTVADTGTGMDAATLDRIFEPFFTTKEQGKGSGLGLATIYGIVKQHDGFIDVESAPGRGASFRIYLPVGTGVPDVSTKPLPQPVRGGKETILVAEDHDGIRRMVADMLRALGYNVLLANDGEEAVRLFEANRERIALALLDVVMPRLSGPDAYTRMTSLQPGLPVLFSTGYSSESALLSDMLQRGIGVLQKPYSPSILGRRIREILDRSPRPSCPPGHGLADND
ncbi:MAG: PAS domain S-box protein [Acidobacteria bacterium]|nr:PAS domain S-box protein [Acidobacteriota bacterium]MBI3663880.1 PAS domain S-box protein [Acidobacteriota bacterium]